MSLWDTLILTGGTAFSRFLNLMFFENTCIPLSVSRRVIDTDETRALTTDPTSKLPPGSR